MSIDLKGEVIIFHAGSLARPLEAMADSFRVQHPGILLVRRAGGSAELARLIALRKMPVDIFASADYMVIDEILMPVHAGWNMWFAANQMVLCYIEKSRYAAEVGPENWYHILTRPHVAWGHTDPHLDPCGYRSLMVMQLAEVHYQQSGLYRNLLASRPRDKVMPNAAELIARLQEGALDYAWEYLSVAMQHGLKYVDLPQEINLGNPGLDWFYRRAKVEVSGAQSGTSVVKVGQSCTYGVTMITDGPNPRSAEAFLSYLLDKEGGFQILRQMGLPPMEPPLVAATAMKAKLPAALRERVKVVGQE
uniref:Substrate-binding domain-containing protein n=1 Tax=Candidatus Desulfatibia profunda TaxID=2841695 RepID=A0A8J6TNI6_9BACT|nr:substrate-binding domain-containing protein [Candidatus Desulfatibia profunda]